MKHRFINIRNVNMVIAREQSVMIVFCSTHYFNIFKVYIMLMHVSVCAILEFLSMCWTDLLCSFILTLNSLENHSF